jgi:isocitrate/isopropylmalate dehydrogenase
VGEVQGRSKAMPLAQILSAIMALNLECAELDARIQELKAPRDATAQARVMARLEVCNRHLQALKLAYRQLQDLG